MPQPAVQPGGASTSAERSTIGNALRSWWVLLPLVSLGWLAWASFLYAGLRARKRAWLAWAAAYFVLGIAGFLMVDSEGSASGIRGFLDDAGTLLSLVVMIAGFVHALAIRRAFLRRIDILAGHLEPGETRLEATEIAADIARTQPRRARALGIGRPDVEGAFHGGLVDVNSAPAEVLEDLPGVDAKLARRIADVRREINGFSSLEDFGAVLDLPAPLVEGLRGRVVFLR